jgi:hypothetical protein
MQGCYLKDNEHIPEKSLTHLAQDTGILKSSAQSQNS